MITKLQFNVEFVSTGKKIAGLHEFSGGMTAITGANESGKSLRLEMIRYALFGTRALRSPISRYKTLSVTLDFKVNGQEYKVDRGLSKITLFKGDQQVSSGTKATNLAIIDIFGYDLEVFDSANAILQKKAEDLTSKTPAERKKMIDRTIGLHIIDDLISELSEQVGQKKGEAAFYEKAMGEAPTMPEKPSGACQERSVVVEALTQATKNCRLYEANKTKLETMKCAPGILPDGARVTQDTLNDLMTKQALRAVHLKEYETLNREIEQLNGEALKLQQGYASVMNYKIEDLQRYLDQDIETKKALYTEWENKRAALPSTPPFTVKEITDIATAMTNRAIRKKIADLKQHNLSCPNCSHTIYLQADQIQKLEVDIQPLDGEEHITKELSPDQMKRLFQNWDKIEEFNTLPVPENVEFIPAMIHTSSHIRRALEAMDKVKELTEKIASKTEMLVGVKKTLDEATNFEAEIASKQQLLIMWNNYDTQTQRYNEYQKLFTELEPQMKSLAGCYAVEEELKGTLKVITDYERAMEDYNRTLQKFEAATLEFTKVCAEVDKLFSIKKALEGIKPKVKSYLMPSLMRVASNLLSQMTNGDRNRIDITENFDILVDNQLVSELSGSGEAVANLAIRLGLGTVLTNKVFSVLLADEIDSSMDKDRASYTAECLRNLKGTISQIILISHQKPEADHQIEL